MDVRQSEKQICRQIKAVENNIRNEYPWLKHQGYYLLICRYVLYSDVNIDVIGMAIFLGSIFLIVALWILYFWTGTNENLSLWKMAFFVCTVAFAISLLHELEHDIIHNLYFRNALWVQDLMFLGIWLSKLHGNPWFRKEMHLKHHIVSGQTDDAEERLIGLGLPFGWKRLSVTMHPFGMMLVTKDIAPDAPWLNISRLNLTSAPTAFIFSFLTKAFLAYVVMFGLYGPHTDSFLLPLKYWPFFRDANILLCIPNYLRHSALVIMSNCSHYYGDIPEKSVFYQNQILDHPLLYPFQLLCFNFGATHIVHHYVPGQPFYIRQMCYTRVKEFMIEKGVRLNDFAIVARANRYFHYKHNDVTSATSEEVQDHKTPKKIEADYKVVHSYMLFMWLTICSTCGAMLYGVFDQLVVIAFCQRVVSRYITKTAPDA